MYPQVPIIANLAGVSTQRREDILSQYFSPRFMLDVDKERIKNELAPLIFPQLGILREQVERLQANGLLVSRPSVKNALMALDEVVVAGVRGAIAIADVRPKNPLVKAFSNAPYFEELKHVFLYLI